MNNDKTKGATVPVQAVTPPNAWRISAPRGCKFELHDRDEAFAFEAVKPGDAMLLRDATGDFAWGGRSPRVPRSSRANLSSQFYPESREAVLKWIYAHGIKKNDLISIIETSL